MFKLAKEKLKHKISSTYEKYKSGIAIMLLLVLFFVYILGLTLISEIESYLEK